MTKKRRRAASKRSATASPRAASPRPRRARTLPLVVIALVAVAAGIWLARRVLAPAPPTVVVVLIDTLRQDALGIYGDPAGTTPHLDAIAAEAVTFREAISTSGWTLPAVGSLLTGTWPTLHGGFGKGVLLTPIRDEVPTAAEILRDAGFRTTGIANAAFVSPMLNLHRGFDVFDHRYAYNSFIRRADESVDDALGHIREHRRKPHFVFLHLFDPHLNYDPPGAWTARFTDGRTTPTPPLDMTYCRELGPEGTGYTRGVYLGELGFVDRQVGRLAAELRTLGLWERCTFVVLSDHGEELWDHDEFEHGHSLYDELIRIPLIVKPPAAVAAAARTVSAQVRILDVMSTVLELVGVDAPASFAGESLVSRILGDETADLAAFSEGTLYGNNKLSWRTRDHKLIYDLNAAPAERVELYDRRRDPAERSNLARTEPETAARLESVLAAFVDEMTDRALGMSQPEPRSLAPDDIERLRSLGYIR